MRRAVIAACLLIAILPAAALAAPPPNDNRSSAQSLNPLPTSVQGTTGEATVEEGERVPVCGPLGPSVWYSATAENAGRIAVRFDAGGDLDATLEVFKVVRSQLDVVGCDRSDTQGKAALNFAAASGGRYLIRVSQLPDSAPGPFSLRVSAPAFPTEPPGTPLPAGGATRTLDRIDNVDSAWSVVLNAGITYRLRLSGRDGTCSPTAQIYAPGTTSFESAAPARFLRCGQTLVITPRPGEGGRYPIHVIASPTTRRAQGYHLQLGVAGADDIAPGMPIHNHRRVSGGLRGDRIDDVDLYRFYLTHRSRTTVSLATDQRFRVILLSDGGRRLANGFDSVESTLRPGRYFIAVRAVGSAAGRYRLKRDSRVLTRTGLRATVAGSVATLVSATSPAPDGPVQIVVEHFDPLVGWLFATQFDLRATAGRATTTFTGLLGRYRATAQFLGTRDAATSTSRTVQFRLRAH